MTEIDSQLVVKCLSKDHDFITIKDSWNAFVETCQPEKLFYRHEWFEAMRKWHHGMCTPYVLLFYRNEKLIGICPLMSCQCRRGFISYRMLGFIMIPASPYHDIICNQDDLPIVLDAFGDYITKNSSSWDIIVLKHMTKRTFTSLRHNDTLSGLPFKQSITGSEYSSIVSLESSWDNYYAQRSKNVRKNNNNASNKLHKMGDATVSHYQIDALDAEKINTLISEISVIADNSWKNGTVNNLSKPSGQKYLYNLFHQSKLNHGINLWILRLDNVAIAHEIQLIDNNDVYALHADFHNNYERLSPGSYLNYYIIKALFNTEYTNYHMGPGGQRYKKAWENNEQELSQITYFANSAKSKILQMQNKIKPFL